MEYKANVDERRKGDVGNELWGIYVAISEEPSLIHCGDLLISSLLPFAIGGWKDLFGTAFLANETQGVDYC